MSREQLLADALELGKAQLIEAVGRTSSRPANPTYAQIPFGPIARSWPAWSQTIVAVSPTLYIDLITE